MWAVISHIEPDRAYLVRCACQDVKRLAGDIYCIAIFKGAAFQSNGAAEGARPPYGIINRGNQKTGIPSRA